MKKPEQTIEEEYTNLLKNFKPKFGDELSLQIIGTLKKVEDLQEEIERRLKDIKIIKKKREDLNRFKRQIIYLLKK